MIIDALKLRGFRNYIELELSFSPVLNLFVGENAQGKTNILEAIYLSALGISHRRATDAEMIHWDQTSAAIEISFISNGLDNLQQLHLFSNRQRQLKFNGYKAKLRQTSATLNTVLFSPEDLWLIKGAPAVRRRFLDNEISQANRTYYDNLLRYQHSLLQRNNLLKKIRLHAEHVAQLESWNQQIINLAAIITTKRMEVLKKLSMLANLMHRRLTNGHENLNITYTISQLDQEYNAQSLNLLDWYYTKINENQAQDILYGNTSVGPHRDDITISLNNKSLKIYGSQGQQRTGALALKLAELEFIKSETGEYPILLLDDVLSELDCSRRDHLICFIIKNKIQTFITTTDAAYFPDDLLYKKFVVSKGNIS